VILFIEETQHFKNVPPSLGDSMLPVNDATFLLVPRKRATKAVLLGLHVSNHFATLRDQHGINEISLAELKTEKKLGMCWMCFRCATGHCQRPLHTGTINNPANCCAKTSTSGDGTRFLHTVTCYSPWSTSGAKNFAPATRPITKLNKGLNNRKRRTPEQAMKDNQISVALEKTF
jgi:hypothetical protein